MKSKVQAIYKETVQQLTKIYDETEAQSIVNILFEDLHQISKTDRLTAPGRQFSPEQLKMHIEAVKHLLNHKPVQQVVGHCFFYGKKFEVNQYILIPRPETEELVHLIIRSENRSDSLKILDIGTGSGCIAISLASALPDVEVHAWDISEEALHLAGRNANANNVRVAFRTEDILVYSGTEKFDLIVSNPPYIPLSEKAAMNENVTRYEPETALFVTDNDPLLFYRTIGKMAGKNLTKKGRLYFEIHEKFGAEIKDMLKDMEYYEHVSIIQDLQGKDRMIKAEISS